MNSAKEHSDHQLTLFSRILTGEATEADRQEFNELMTTDPEAATEFEKLNKLWSESKSIDQPTNQEIASDWQNIQSHIRKSRSARYSFLRIAASILIAVGLGLVAFLLWPASDTIIMTATNSQVEVLPDGSTITLNHHSRISYAADFGEKDRVVTFEGEAFFEIAKNAEKPFIVKMPNSTVEVLGTKFTIKNRENTPTDLSVIEGKVQFGDGEQQQIVVEGMAASYDPSTSNLSVNNNLDKNALAWKTRQLVFDDSSLEYVAVILESVYAKEISVAEASQNCTITVSFENASLQEILDILSATLGVQVDQKGNLVTISGASCP